MGWNAPKGPWRSDEPRLDTEEWLVEDNARLRAKLAAAEAREARLRDKMEAIAASLHTTFRVSVAIRAALQEPTGDEGRSCETCVNVNREPTWGECSVCYSKENKPYWRPRILPAPPKDPS